MGPRKKDVTDRIISLGKKITQRQSQLDLLNQVTSNSSLFKSKILSSIQPSVGIKFHHRDLEKKKIDILQGARLSIINNCSVEEATRDINRNKLNLNRVLRRAPDRGKMEELIRNSQQKVKNECTKRLQSKVKFHLDQQRAAQPSVTSNTCQKRNDQRRTTRKRSKQARKRYKQRKRIEKQRWILTCPTLLISTWREGLISFNLKKQVRRILNLMQRNSFASLNG